jgi:hypothetical protein
MNKPIALPALALGIFIAALALSAAAQAPAQKRIGTRDELRACMKSDDDLQLRQKALRERVDKLGIEAKAIQAEGEELLPDQKRLDEPDAPSGPARQRIERKLKAHELRVKAAKQAEATFESDRQAFDKDAAGWREQCSNTVSFDAKDNEAVLKEREAAKK